MPGHSNDNTPRGGTGSLALKLATRPGLRPWLLGAVYAVFVLAPLGFAYSYGPVTGSIVNFIANPDAGLSTNPTPVNTVASVLGLVAFSALLVEFLFSGRTRWVSGQIGARQTLRIHRRVAYAIIACIVIHPFLYTAPNGVSWPWFNADDPSLALSNGSLLCGLAAWILTAAIILIAVDHKKLPGSYRVWRMLHAGSAMVIGILVAIHAITAGGYSSQPALMAYWTLLLGAGIVTLLEMFIVKPWRDDRQARRRRRDGAAGFREHQRER